MRLAGGAGQHPTVSMNVGHRRRRLRSTAMARSSGTATGALRRHLRAAAACAGRRTTTAQSARVLSRSSSPPEVHHRRRPAVAPLRASGRLHLCYSEDVTVDSVTIRNNERRGPARPVHRWHRHRLLAPRDHPAMPTSPSTTTPCVMKAGRDADGLRVARIAARTSVISDCIVREGAAGLTFGSEMLGGLSATSMCSGIEVHAPVPVGLLFKSGTHTRRLRRATCRISDLTLHRRTGRACARR